MRLTTRTLCIVHSALCIFLMAPCAMRADTDVYGNEIIYENGQVKYQFWQSGPTLESSTTTGTSTGGYTMESTFEARCKTILAAFGRITSKPWCGFFMYFH